MQRNSEPSKVYLLGTDIQKSLSPSIHNSLFRRLEINARYSLYDVQESQLEGAIFQILQSKEVLGFNITAPFKERVMQHLSRIDSVSSDTGAVNTVKISARGASSGYNTDVDGVRATLVELGFSNKKKSATSLKATILGAGGAARACAYAILNDGFRSVTIANRSDQRAQTLIRHFNSQFPLSNFQSIGLTHGEVSKELADSDLLINAISESAPALKLDFSKASKNLRFFDLGYKHESTLLAAARDAGIKSLDGLVMLAEQARKSFEIWTGVSPSSELVRSIARRSLHQV